MIDTSITLISTRFSAVANDFLNLANEYSRGLFVYLIDCDGRYEVRCNDKNHLACRDLMLLAVAFTQGIETADSCSTKRQTRVNLN